MLEYDPQHWRLSVNWSKRSLKCVFLHNYNGFGSILPGYSTTLKEKYNEILSLCQKEILTFFG